MGALRRVAVAGVVLVCALVGVGLFGCVAAFAGATHEYLSQITTVPAKGPAPAEEPVALPGPLGEVHALAVDAGGLYVADGEAEGNRLDRFDVSSDAFLSQFAQAPGVSYLHDGVAVGHTTGETQVYVGGDERHGGPSEGAVVVFGGAGSVLGGSPWTGADTPSGSFGCFECYVDGGVVAVDESAALGDWASGDVYVTNPEHGVVDVLKPKAGGGEEYVTRLTGVEGGEPFNNPTAVAVDRANGDVLVVDRESVVDVFEPVSGLPGVYQYLFAISGTPTGSLSQIRGLAVDGGNGEVFASALEEGRGVVDEFSAGGVFLGQLTGTPAGPFGVTEGLTVDPGTHHLFVGDHPQGTGGVVDVFGPDLTVPDVVSAPASGVASGGATLNGTVNPDGVALSDCHFVYGTTSAYGQSVPCAQSPAEIGAGNTPVAVTANISGLTPGAVYHYRLIAGNTNGASRGLDRVLGAPSIENSSAGGETKTTATLTAHIDPEGLASTYRFEYGTTSAYGTSVPVPDGNLGSGEEAVPVSVELTGLQAGVSYHYRVVAVNAAGTTASADATFATIPPASIDSVTITNVTAISASVHAQINPLGSDTAYRFEYGASTAYGSSIPIPDSDIGSGESDVAVGQQLTGLTANTTYHLRVVAHNALGTVRSGDHTFVYDTSGERLPDNRAYELVTPAHKNGALIGLTNEPKISEDGSRVMSKSLQCFAGAGSCSALRENVFGGAYEFARTPDGWLTTPLDPAATQLPVSVPIELRADAGTSLFLASPPSANAKVWYVRGADGSLVDIGPLEPLAAGSESEVSSSSPNVVSTPDFSHIVWETNSGHWPFDATPAGLNGNSVYEYVGAGNTQPLLVGVSGGLGSTDLIGTCGTNLGTANVLTPGTLSDDGRMVFFSVTPCLSGSGANAGVPVPAEALYARIDESRTVAISGRSPADCTGVCLSSPPGDALFSGASEDGSKVLFKSTQQLMDGASEDDHAGDTAVNHGNGQDCLGTVGVNGCNLYLYDFANAAGHELIDVSAGDSSGGGPRVQGVMALSADGSHIYFVAKGVLTGSANAAGESAQDGVDNLYVFERDARYPEGHVAFIAVLPGIEKAEWHNNTGEPANVTPDGRFLVFVSSGRLTADETSVSGALQVFRYDSQTGALVRISVGNDGFNDNGDAPSPIPCGGGIGCSIDATIVPAANNHVRRDPTMSNDGSFVFFRSSEALTPHALNDVQIGAHAGVYAQNVYEWHEGHVYLISDGRDVHFGGGQCETGNFATPFTGSSSVCLLGVDGSGANVFFTTADPLVGQDVDTELDYYDARICTTSDPCIPSTPPASTGCEGEACHGTPPGEPGLSGAATVTFGGPGNLPPVPATRQPATRKTPVKCTKGRRAKHGRCVKPARRKKPKAKRAKSIHGGQK